MIETEGKQIIHSKGRTGGESEDTDTKGSIDSIKCMAIDRVRGRERRGEGGVEGRHTEEH